MDTDWGTVLREFREFSLIGFDALQFVNIRAIRVKSPPHVFSSPSVV